MTPITNVKITFLLYINSTFSRSLEQPFLALTRTAEWVSAKKDYGKLVL